MGSNSQRDGIGSRSSVCQLLVLCMCFVTLFFLEVVESRRVSFPHHGNPFMRRPRRGGEVLVHDDAITIEASPSSAAILKAGYAEHLRRNLKKAFRLQLLHQNQYDKNPHHHHHHHTVHHNNNPHSPLVQSHPSEDEFLVLSRQSKNKKPNKQHQKPTHHHREAHSHHLLPGRVQFLTSYDDDDKSSGNLPSSSPSSSHSGNYYNDEFSEAAAERGRYVAFDDSSAVNGEDEEDQHFYQERYKSSSEGNKEEAEQEQQDEADPNPDNADATAAAVIKKDDEPSSSSSSTKSEAGVVESSDERHSLVNSYFDNEYSLSMLHKMECVTPTKSKGYCSTFRTCVPTLFNDEGELEAPALAELVSMSIGYCTSTIPSEISEATYLMKRLGPPRYNKVANRIICCPGTPPPPGESAEKDSAEKLNDFLAGGSETFVSAGEEDDGGGTLHRESEGTKNKTIDPLKGEFVEQVVDTEAEVWHSEEEFQASKNKRPDHIIPIEAFIPADKLAHYDPQTNTFSKEIFNSAEKTASGDTAAPQSVSSSNNNNVNKENNSPETLVTQQNDEFINEANDHQNQQASSLSHSHVFQDGSGLPSDEGIATVTEPESFTTTASPSIPEEEEQKRGENSTFIKISPDPVIGVNGKFTLEKGVHVEKTNPNKITNPTIVTVNNMHHFGGGVGETTVNIIKTEGTVESNQVFLYRPTTKDPLHHHDDNHNDMQQNSQGGGPVEIVYDHHASNNVHNVHAAPEVVEEQTTPYSVELNLESAEVGIDSLHLHDHHHVDISVTTTMPPLESETTTGSYLSDAEIFPEDIYVTTIPPPTIPEGVNHHDEQVDTGIAQQPTWPAQTTQTDNSNNLQNQHQIQPENIHHQQPQDSDHVPQFDHGIPTYPSGESVQGQSHFTNDLGEEEVLYTTTPGSVSDEQEVAYTSTPLPPVVQDHFGHVDNSISLQDQHQIQPENIQVISQPQEEGQGSLEKVSANEHDDSKIHMPHRQPPPPALPPRLQLFPTTAAPLAPQDSEIYPVEDKFGTSHHHAVSSIAITQDEKGVHKISIIPNAGHKTPIHTILEQGILSSLLPTFPTTATTTTSSTTYIPLTTTETTTTTTTTPTTTTSTVPSTTTTTPTANYQQPLQIAPEIGGLSPDITGVINGLPTGIATQHHDYQIFSACATQDYYRSLDLDNGYKQYPYLATIVGGSRPFCSGTLITDRHILTASHFLSNITVADVFHMRVHIGYKVQSQGQTEGPFAVRKVLKVIRHKGFSFDKLLNDVAILLLDKPVRFSEDCHPVCLSNTPNLYATAGTSSIQAFETGWIEDPQMKKISPHHPFIDPHILKYFSFGYKNVTWTLQQSVTRLRTNVECQANYEFLEKSGIYITDSMLCAATEDGKSCSFKGNSGAPLVIHRDGKPIQLGLVSWGIGCGHFPAVFTGVSNYLPWIEKVVQRTS